MDDPVGLGGATGNLRGAAAAENFNHASEQETWASESRLWNYTSARVV